MPVNIQHYQGVSRDTSPMRLFVQYLNSIRSTTIQIMEPLQNPLLLLGSDVMLVVSCLCDLCVSTVWFGLWLRRVLDKLGGGVCAFACSLKFPSKCVSVALFFHVVGHASSSSGALQEVSLGEWIWNMGSCYARARKSEVPTWQSQID